MPYFNKVTQVHAPSAFHKNGVTYQWETAAHATIEAADDEVNKAFIFPDKTRTIVTELVKLTDEEAKEHNFKIACQKHDLTFNYSDDHSVWKRGQAQLDAIREMAKNLGQEKATKIWNEVIDTKMRPESREQFYW